MDWTCGLTLKIIFTLSNETHLPVELCGNPAFSLASAHDDTACYHNGI